MAIPIPSGLPINPSLDVRSNDLLTPPSAPSVVENVQAIDPRVALTMPMPVNGSPDSLAIKDALLARQNSSAVLLEISNPAALEESLQGPIISDSLNKMDSLGSAALGQLLSNILFAEGGQDQASSDLHTVNAQMASVLWPSRPGATNLSADPKEALKSLYANLQNSGIFAADQLKKLLMPTEAQDLSASKDGSIEKQASYLLSQLDSGSPPLKDAVKLLLRGDLVWQGEITPGTQAKVYRNDAWQADPQNPLELRRGSQLTMELSLPNLGKLQIVGTQFGELVNVKVSATDQSNQLLQSKFDLLVKEMNEQFDQKTSVSLSSESND